MSALAFKTGLFRVRNHTYLKEPSCAEQISADVLGLGAASAALKLFGGAVRRRFGSELL
jgi:hypothetical protein